MRLQTKTQNLQVSDDENVYDEQGNCIGKKKTQGKITKNGNSFYVIGADGKAVEVDKDGNPIKKNGAFKIKGKAGYHDENGNWVDDAEGP